MTPAVYTYENPEKQTVYYRGYVKQYQGATVITHPCSTVRHNRIQALADAKKTIKKYANTNTTRSFGTLW